MADLENLSGLLVQPKGLKFIMEPQLPLPEKVIADGTRLRQILWNLIGNAVKFTQQGKIVVRVRREGNDRLILKSKIQAWGYRKTNKIKFSPCIIR